MNGDFVRRRMKELGLRQKDLADAMKLPQSAISNIIQGKRRIKVEEADVLLPILGEDGQKGREVPVLPLEQVMFWEDASGRSKLFAHYTNTNIGEKSFAVELDAGDGGMLPGMLHVVVDTDKRSLFVGNVYLVEASNIYKFYRYYEAPSRLKPMAPFGDDDSLEVGQSAFRVIGEVQAVIKRPATIPLYGEG